MKNKLILSLIILSICRSLHAAPTAGVSGISGNSDRAQAVGLIIERHILEILKKNGFGTIPPDTVSRELSRFNCTEEKCILNFAENADLDIIVSGRITDSKSFLTIKLEAFGIEVPFNKRVICRYEVKIPMDVSISSREFSLISEEHAALFLSKMLNVFVYRAKIRSAGGKFLLADDLKISGRFKIYSADKSGIITGAGEAEVSDAEVRLIKCASVPEGGFILLPFKDRSAAIDTYYRDRKREIVFRQTSLYDTLFLFVVTPFASASMPLSSPFLGYYINDDWTGMGLWMVNATPWLYIEARGFLNSPSRLKDSGHNITRDDRAMNYFAWYMLFAGGMPLFIDSYASSYLHRASYFTGNNAMLGNSATAAMLSLTGNGSGLFYRGDRFWGYFYFHVNNALLYMTLREYSRPETYDISTGQYTKGGRNIKKAAIYGSIFGVSKTVEIIHAVLKKEDLTSGETADEYIIPGPLFTVDDRGNPFFGVNITLRF